MFKVSFKIKISECKNVKKKIFLINIFFYCTLELSLQGKVYYVRFTIFDFNN